MKNEKSLWKNLLILVPLGLALNYAGSLIPLRFGLPLYLDSAGTMPCAALGDFMPGMLTGFLYNAIGGLSSTVTLYYGVISALLACVAAIFFTKGSFSQLLANPADDAGFFRDRRPLGSAMTLMFYQLKTGKACLRRICALVGMGFAEIPAQLTADFAVDFADKLITVALVYLALHLLPAKWKKPPLLRATCIRVRSTFGLSGPTERPGGVPCATRWSG